MKIVACCCLILLTVGCASVHYTAPGGEEFNYSRLGIQKIEGFTMSKDSNGLITVSFGKQEGSEGQLLETLKNISQVAAQIATKAP